MWTCQKKKEKRKLKEIFIHNPDSDPIPFPCEDLHQPAAKH
jgi:hypothetical protein